MTEKHLYQCFQHWFRGGQILFYSDPHFNDQEMMYLRHGYIGDDEQVKKINSMVNKLDTIIFLGDIGDIEYIKKIKGYKVLIMGNHDRGASYYHTVFDEVYEGPLTISSKIILSHEPINYDFALNIHGHDHSKWFNSPLHMNVCAEHINYTPVTLKSIIKSGILKNIPDIHRNTIDNAIDRKNKREKREGENK